MAPTAWEFRNKLMAILNVAKQSGEPYVDVESSELHAQLGGDASTMQRLPICHDIMKKIMRPGDLILKESQNGDRATMMIRYILKNKRDN